MPNNCLSVLYIHIIQVENKNVGLKVGGHKHTPLAPPPPPPIPTPVNNNNNLNIIMLLVVYLKCIPNMIILFYFIYVFLFF